MSQADREKWESRYVQGSYQARSYPSAFLTQWLPRINPGRALDVACGAGRNALYEAERGFEVDAIDISSSALEQAKASAKVRGVRVNWIEADLDDHQLPSSHYRLVSVIRYINRALMAQLTDTLEPDGWLIFEHHYQTDQPVGGPRGSDFRLAPQELLQRFRALRVIHYLEDIVDDPDGRRMALARLVARRQ